MKSRILSFFLVLIFVGALVYMGNPDILLSRGPGTALFQQEVWIPPNPADWSPNGRQIVRDHIKYIKKRLADMSGNLTTGQIDIIYDFFKHRGWIETHDGRTISANAIFGYLTSQQKNISSIKFELVKFTAEEFTNMVKLPKQKQQPTDVLHSVKLEFKLTYVYQGKVIDPDGGREDRHRRTCEWIDP